MRPFSKKRITIGPCRTTTKTLDPTKISGPPEMYGSWSKYPDPSQNTRILIKIPGPNQNTRILIEIPRSWLKIPDSNPQLRTLQDLQTAASEMELLDPVARGRLINSCTNQQFSVSCTDTRVNYMFLTKTRILTFTASNRILTKIWP